MSSKKEEEKNEKIIRGLLKLPPNRRCINCDSLGPQYACTTFWTFICITCSGIHREFTHRVKSVSMAKFTTQEVEALQRGGNQRAREMFLKDWDSQRMRLPDSSNIDRIREFIKNVYVDKKYAGGRSSDKPPRDTQSLKNHEDHRRASSYHSFSQSPPYEHQYEDRRYGKQTGMLSRKPGSDRGHYEGKISSFMCSPGHLGEQMYEDSFANEISDSRTADYSVSSTGDPFRSDDQSPNFQDTGYSSPPLHQVRDILIEDAQPHALNTYAEANAKRYFHGIPRPLRTTSSGSFGSLDGNSVSPNSGSLTDIVLEPEQASGTQQSKTYAFPSSHLSASTHSTNQDLFNLPSVHQPAMSLAPSIDLFADINHQASSTTPSEQKTLAAPFSENVGWAIFDLPHHAGPSSETNKGLPSTILTGEEAYKGNINAISSMHSNSQWLPEQNSATHGPSQLMADQWHAGLHEVKRSADPKNSQSWNAFDDSTGSASKTSFWNLPQNSGTQVLVNKPPTSGDPYINLKVPEVSIKNGFQKSAVADNGLDLTLPFNGIAGSSFSPSVIPLTGGATQERKSTNPFDLPYDSDTEANNVFLDTSSLQAALPDPELPTTLLGGFSPWISQSPLTTYIPSAPQGDSAYIVDQVPGSQFQNIPAQGGPVASLGGNPFA